MHMGKVLEYLGELLDRCVKDHGIVVWFDPEKHYKNILHDLDLKDLQVFEFSDSFFDLRHKIDSLLEQENAPKMIVYVPKDRSKTDDALIELEKAGCAIFPGHSSRNQNTRLEVLTRAVLMNMDPDEVEKICKQVSTGSLTLEEIESIADNQVARASGTINLIFKTIDPLELALIFITQTSLDENIIKKNVMPELITQFKSSLGITLKDGIKPDKAREQMIRYVLLGDFLKDIPSDKVPAELSTVPVSKEPIHTENAAAIAHKWRVNAEHKQLYVSESDKLTEQLGVSHYHIPSELLLDSETFKATEDALFNYACELVLRGDLAKVMELAEKRKSCFWCRADEQVLLNWSIIETASRLIACAGRITEELKKRKDWTPSDMVNKYCSDEKPWFELDETQRELEHRIERFDFGKYGYDAIAEKVIVKARNEYNQCLTGMTLTFQNAFTSHGFSVKGLARQQETFKKELEPLVGKEKVAYIWVDALRYEMAVQLCRGFDQGFKVSIIPSVAVLPCITEIGMASLLPGAQKEISLADVSGNRLGLVINGEVLDTRSKRIGFLSEYLSGIKFAEAKTDAIVKRRKKTRDEISESDFALVTSQDIDGICERDDAPKPRQILGEVLDNLRRAVINLSDLGIESFVIVADHGHIFLDTINEGNKIDAPGGHTAALHPRAWVGNGGAESASYIRMKEKDIGLQGDMELAFPKGIGCFKVKGPDKPYFHGGVSLQEMIIPVIIIKGKSKTTVHTTAESIKLSMDKPKITNRLFSVVIEWTSPKQQQLIPVDANQRRVRLVVRSGRDDIGMAVQAMYGYQDATGDIILEKDKPNYIMLMITDEDFRQGSVMIRLLDSETMVELGNLEKDIDIAL